MIINAQEALLLSVDEGGHAASSASINGAVFNFPVSFWVAAKKNHLFKNGFKNLSLESSALD